MAVQINEAGSDDQAGGVENFGIARGEIGADADYARAMHEHVVACVGFARRIEHAAVLYEQHAVVSGRHDWASLRLVRNFAWRRRFHGGAADEMVEQGHADG